jgi:hypothetical protein
LTEDVCSCEADLSGSRQEGQDVSLTWNAETERLMTGASEAGGVLGVVRSASRTSADVLRLVRENRPLVVLLPMYQEPVDSLLQLRPYLDDDELSVVARALGF